MRRADDLGSRHSLLPITHLSTQGPHPRSSHFRVGAGLGRRCAARHDLEVPNLLCAVLRDTLLLWTSARPWERTAAPAPRGRAARCRVRGIVHQATTVQRSGLREASDWVYAAFVTRSGCWAEAVNPAPRVGALEWAKPVVRRANTPRGGRFLCLFRERPESTGRN
jgi:hypothetical protein